MPSGNHLSFLDSRPVLIVAAIILLGLAFWYGRSG